jgi:hypothetical protein
MDGRLFETMYSTIRSEYSPVDRPRRAGRPRVYRTDEILLVWAFAALMNWPISVARQNLLLEAVVWWLDRHWSARLRVPSLGTLTQRAKQSDFRWLLRRVLRRLRSTLSLTPTEHVVMDSTFLCTGPHSRDPQSRWTCHGGKWFRGYALHAICDQRGVLWSWQVTSANVQEMKVARRLVRRLALVKPGAVKLLVADSGYDSEPLHELTRRRLNVPLLAPLNLRGAKSGDWRSGQPGRAAAEKMLATDEGKAAIRDRSAVERWNSWFKGTSLVSMLPYHVRRLRRVRQWIDLKLMAFFVHQWLTYSAVKPAS